MEDEKDSNQSLKPISRPHKDRYSTYSPNKFTGIGDKIKKKKLCSQIEHRIFLSVLYIIMNKLT